MNFFILNHVNRVSDTGFYLLFRQIGIICFDKIIKLKLIFKV